MYPVVDDVPSCTVDPAQSNWFGPALETGFGLTCTTTVSASVQPNAFTLTMYVLLTGVVPVLVPVTLVTALLEFDRPVEGVQL